MTLDEIRREKHVAEDAIRDVLSKLGERTGFCPIGVNVSTVSVTNIDSMGRELRISSVTVELQSI